MIGDKSAAGDSLAKLLRGIGRQFMTTKDAPIGRKLARSGPFGLVFIDLPLTRAQQLLDELTENRPAPAVVVVSSESQPAPIDWLKAGAFGCLTKPVQPDELKIITERALERWDLIEQNRAKAAALAQTNKDLEKANAYVQKLLDAKSQFVEMMNHEMRTSLTIIQGFSETSLSRFDHLDTKRLKFYLKIINDGSSRLARLIEGLMDLTNGR
ncbi:MAG: response regulator [Elusimicrobia bacterium]|nr:response regulator [Elusimicrobiota bacterium]